MPILVIQVLLEETGGVSRFPEDISAWGCGCKSNSNGSLVSVLVAFAVMLATTAREFTAERL
jgi:hypothetical protein